MIGGEELPTEHPRIMKANESALNWPQMQQLMLDMHAACDAYDIKAIRELLLNSHIAFAPSDENCDLVALNLQQVHENNSSKIKRVV